MSTFEKHKKKEDVVILRDVLLSYSSLWEPSKYFGGEDRPPKYGAEFLIAEKDDTYKHLVMMVKDIATKVFKSDREDYALRIYSGDNQVGMGGAPSSNPKPHRIGYYYFKGKNKAQPEIRDKNGERANSIDDPFYPGARVDAWIKINIYRHKHAKQVTYELLGIQKFKDAPEFDLTPKTVLDSDEEFKDYT